ncbi:MAG: hypothetical protein ABSB33_00580 [Tepidisphaeraceae bacterium]
MTNIPTPNRGTPSQSTSSVKLALLWAWLCWAILLVIPFLLLQWVIWRLHTVEVARPHADAAKWFVAAMAYLLVILPGSFFWRGHLFKNYWLGRPVAPHKYVVATISIGLALALGGVFSLIGCLVTHSLMPNLIPALLSLLLFAIHWPTGRAMVRPVGHVEDPQVYEEPR